MKGNQVTLMKSKQEQQQQQVAMGQRPAGGGAEPAGTQLTGMHKLQRLNSANAAFRDKRGAEDGAHRGGMLQAPMVSGVASGATLATVGGGPLGNVGSSDVQNHDGTGGQRFQNQAYAVQQSQQQYNQRHAMRVREQRTSASAGRDGGLSAQQDRGPVPGHHQGGANAAHDHYTMRFGQLGHFGQQVAAGHLSGRSAGQANQRVGGNALEPTATMRPPVNQYGSAQNLKFGERRTSAASSSSPAYGSLFTGPASTNQNAYAHSMQTKQEQPLQRGNQAAPNTFYNATYNSKLLAGPASGSTAQSGTAPTSEQRSNSVKVTPNSRHNQQNHLGMSPQQSYHEKFAQNAPHAQSNLYHQQQSPQHYGQKHHGNKVASSAYPQQQAQQPANNLASNYQSSQQLGMYKPQASASFPQRQAQLQKGNNGSSSMAAMGSPKMNNLLPPGSERVGDGREPKQQHNQALMAYQTSGQGSGPGNPSLKTPKPRQKPQLPQPINTENSAAPYDFYRTGSGGATGAPGGFLPQQPNSTKAASGYAQQISSGRNTFHTSNSQTRPEASSSATSGPQHQQNAAQRPPPASSIYQPQGQQMRHNSRKQIGTRSEQKVSQTTSYQRPHMPDSSNPSQFQPPQQRDLRKIRDESTQGSRSRAPNFQLYQSSQGSSYSGLAQQPPSSQGGNRALAREERGRANQHQLTQQQSRSKFGHASHSQGRDTASASVPSLMAENSGRDGGPTAHQQQTGNPAFRNTFYQQSSKEQSGRLNNSSTLSSGGPQGATVGQPAALKRQRSQQFRSAQHGPGGQGPLLPPSAQASQAQQHEDEAKKQLSATMQGLPFENLEGQAEEDPHTLSPNHHFSNPQFVGQTNLDVQTLFKQNASLITKQIKVDPATGLQQKIQQLTTLDIKKMIHEVSADEEGEGQKLALQPGARIIIPNKEPTKCSIKRNGIVRAYAAITNQGLVRTYNEDRVSIILNITKPSHRKDEVWPKCSFFGVYDGHGGHNCAEFLRDQLHHFVVKQDCFPQDPREAIVRGFRKAEETFLQMCQGRDENGNAIVVDRSGSCAIVILIVGDMCYSANVGDSRAAISINGGQIVMPLSRDHKPSDANEYARIVQNGGQVYQTTTAQSLEPDPAAAKGKGKNSAQKGQNPGDPKAIKWSEPEYVIGPIRVLPGRLSVSRTFGDPEAKLAYRGGNANVVKAEPEIRQFQIHKNHDFIMLASDGVFDKMSNEDISKCVWESCDKNKWQANPSYRPAQSVHQQCGLAVESVLKNSLYRQSLDNVTVVMIAFQNFKRKVFGQGKNSDRDEQSQQHNVETQSSTKPESSKKAESILASDKQVTSSSNAAKSTTSFQNQDQISQPSGKQHQAPSHQIQSSSQAKGMHDIQPAKTANFNNTATNFSFQKRSSPMHASSSGAKVTSLSRPSTQQTQNQRMESKLQNRGSTGSLPTHHQSGTPSGKSKQDGLQHRPPVTRGSAQGLASGLGSAARNREERFMGKRDHQVHPGNRGGSQQHRQGSTGADQRGSAQKMQGAADEGSTAQNRGSINRRVQSKNQRDGPSGSQVRGASSSQLHTSSSQSKAAHGSTTAVGSGSATGAYHSASKNSRPLAPSVSQGGTSAHQQRSNSKVSSHADDNQMQTMPASFKGGSKNQTATSGKPNRRAGSGHAEAAAAAGEYTKMSGKSGHGGNQLHPGQHSAIGVHSTSMTQPPHQSNDSFANSAHGQPGAHTGVPPAHATGVASSLQHLAFHPDGHHPSSNLDQHHQHLPSQQQFASYEPNSLL